MIQAATVAVANETAHQPTRDLIRAGAEEIQASWTRAERRRRASLGRRRQAELAQLIFGEKLEQEIWAVASLTGEDLVRVAG